MERPTIVISIDDQFSVIRTTKYKSPSVTGIAGFTVRTEEWPHGLPLPGTQKSPQIAQNLHTDGNERITLLGKNFGPPDEYKRNHSQDIAVTVTYGPTGNEWECVDPVVVTHGSVDCTTQAGVGPEIRFKIYVHDQNSSVSDWWVRYAPPVASASRQIEHTVQTPILVLGKGRNKASRRHAQERRLN